MPTNNTHNESLHGKAIRILEQSLKDSYVQVRGASELEAGIAIEANSLTGFLHESDARTFCILTISFLEDVLRRTMANYWSLTSRELQQDYFGSNGPLSTFSQRILVAVGLGWISQEQAKNATRLRKIRNEFAHNHLIHELTDQRLSKFVDNLHPYDKVWLSIPEYKDAYALLGPENTFRMRVYCNAFQMAGSVLSRAKLLTNGIPANFRIDGGFGGLTEVEQIFGNHMIRFCFNTAGIPFRD